MALIPRGYTTRAEVEDYLMHDLDPAFNEVLDDLIAKAEDFVDGKCRRRFDAYTDTHIVPTARPDRLAIPDTRTLTKVTVRDYHNADRTLSEGEYRLEPTTAKVRGRPYTRLRLTRSNRFIPELPKLGEVELEGEFGWGEVPASIRKATTQLVANATARWRGSDGGAVQSETIGEWSVTYAEPFFEAQADEGWRKQIIPYVRLLPV